MSVFARGKQAAGRGAARFSHADKELEIREL